MRISALRHTLYSTGAAGLLAAAALVLTSPPAAAEGYMSATAPVNGTPPHGQQAQHRAPQQFAALGTPSAEPRRLPPLARAFFFQGRDPNDSETVKRLGTHPGVPVM